MNNKEMIEQIEELKQRIEQLEKEVKSNEPNMAVTAVRWQPILGQTYFYLDAFGNVESINWDFDDIDYYRFNIGNCFKTRQEAEDYRENLLTKQALKDLALKLNGGVDINWNDNDQEKIYLFYNNVTNKLDVNSTYISQSYAICCLNIDFLNIAKHHIGEEKLIKLIRSGV